MNPKELDEPLVSVIMACRNEARFIAAAIDSILRQSYRRLELLVDELTVQLKVSQGATHGIDYVEDIELWRKAARIAGRRLGIAVRTGVSRDGTKVWASEGP